MIYRISNFLSDYICRNEGTPQNQEIYRYGIECILNEIISDFFLILCAIIMHQVIPILIWNISFSLIRIYLGGFHATTHSKCIFYGTIIGTISVYFNFIWTHLNRVELTTLIILLLIFSVKYAPITHKNHPVSISQKSMARKCLIFFITLEGIIIVLFFKSFPFIISPIMTGMMTAFLMGLIEIIIRKLSIFFAS